MWGFPGQETYFSNLRITHAEPAPVRNGSDAPGKWQVPLTTDAGVANGKLTLACERKKVTTEGSGTFGDAVPVEGSWRDGYVELRFTSKLPKEMAGGNAQVTLAGRIDGITGQGQGKSGT